MVIQLNKKADQFGLPFLFLKFITAFREEHRLID
jgi:hypothetical protein